MFQGRNLVTARSESLMSWGSATCSKLQWPAITHTPTEVLTDYAKFCFSTFNQYYLTPFTFQQGKCIFDLKIQLRFFFCHICSFANTPLALIHIQRWMSGIDWVIREREIWSSSWWGENRHVDMSVTSVAMHIRDVGDYDPGFLWKSRE